MNDELDLRQLWKILYKRKNILIYILLTSILLGIIYTFIIKQPIYETKAQILIDKVDTSIEEFAKSKALLNTDKLIVSFNKNNKIITITGNSKNKEEIYNDINKYIENLQTSLVETYDIKTFNIFEKPILPEKPTNINPIKQIITFVGIGIAIFGFYIIIIYSCRGITNTLGIEKELKLKVLGKIDLEKNKKSIDQFKRIQTNIQLNKDSKEPKTILITGIKNKIGTTYITNNLANQYAKIYDKVLIVDADIINGTLTKKLLEDEKEGLTDLLAQGQITDLNKKIYTTKNEKIQILPIGKEKIEEELFFKETIKQIIEELQSKYEIILIDSNSICEKISPIILTSIVDTTILVLELGKTKEEEIIKAKSEIENVGGKISGVILNELM